MPEEEKQPQQSGQETQPYVPASPLKRTLAWVGIVYIVLFVFLNLYPFFHGGENLHGVGPLLVCPGTAGMAVIAFREARRREAPAAKRAGMAVLAVVCAVVFVLGLVDGAAPLLAGLGGGA